MTKKIIDSNSPFCQFVDGLVEEWSQRKFFGIKTDDEATSRIENELKVVANQQKVLDKKVKTLRAIVQKNSFGLKAYLPKVEEELLNTSALLLEMATMVRKWNNRFSKPKGN